MTGPPDAAPSTVASNHLHNHQDQGQDVEGASPAPGAPHQQQQQEDQQPQEQGQYLELTEPSPTDDDDYYNNNNDDDSNDKWRSMAMAGRDFPKDEDATPTSQAPSASGGSRADDLHHHHHDGYFGPISSLEPPAPKLTRSSVMASIVEPSASHQHDAAISHLDLNNLARTHSRTLKPSAAEDAHDRPIPHHSISSSSTASSATVRQSDYLHRTTSRPRYLPHFPEQPYSALHSQHYPQQVLRARSSNPSSYTSYIAGAKGQTVQPGSTPSKSRTADNSPSGSPGLFTPLTSPSRPKSVHDDGSGSYSSPFLHYTQRQVPKETHVADIDVDPVSGRKIINQYEIVDELGRGVHGKVKLGRDMLQGEYVAIKIVERYSKRKRLGKNTNHEDKIKKEIAILKKARHPNIVSLLEVIDDPQRKKVYIVLEFVELGEIAWRTKGLDEINLIEYRRFLREVSGLDNDTDDVAQQEGQILEGARLKRQRARRRQLKLERNRHTENWSFEHQGDEPDDSGDNLSRVSTGTAGSVRSHRSATIHEEMPPLPEPIHQSSQDISPPPPPPPTDNVETSDFATITGLPSADELAKQGMSEGFSDLSNLETITATGLEGTMYGSYEEDVVRGRTPSLAGSAGSLILEDPQQMHVPENFSHVPLMTIVQARNAFRDTVLGLEYLHFQGVIHRDVKPANLLQTKDHRVKISDFGVSYMGRERSSTDPDASESEVPDIDEAVELAKTVGTPAFYAPELCQTNADEDVPTPPVTQQIDVWALGVTLYCLIFGRVPFHDINPYVLMAKIAHDAVHIPKRRLKAVEERSASRPSSRGRMFQSKLNYKRAAYDLEYEDIEEELHDLLRRLFVKDPRQRITLKEVKHHPWVLQGIADPVLWLEETDPARESEAKIQVSREDVQEAVVSLNLIDKIASNLRRGIGNVTGALGLGRSSSTRSRAKSSATNQDGQPPSTASSSSTISQDARRTSLRPDESISWALRASKDPEHPLAQSQTASPAVHKDPNYHYFPPTHPSSLSVSDASDADVESDRSAPARPLAGRALSTNFVRDHTQTIRQKDIIRSKFKENATGVSTYPALPSTPQSLEPPDSAAAGGILGHAGRRLSRLIARSRDRHGSRERSRDSRKSSSTRRSVDVSSESHDDMHAEPSLGLSHAIAAGTLKQPDLPISRPRSSTSNAALSGDSSRAASVTSPDARRKSAFGTSRPSSVSSTSSAQRRPGTASKEAHEQLSPYYAHGGHEQDLDRAREESFRRRIAEEHLSQDKTSRPSSSLNNACQVAEDCPPSPGDLLFYRKQQDEATARLRSPNPALDAQGITSNISPLPPPGHFMTPSSSDDHFTGLSQSTSNPSIPSVVSADSSVSPDFDEQSTPEFSVRTDKDGNATDPPSDSSTIHRQPVSRRQRSGHEDDEGYVGDHAVESEDSDSDDDNFLEIGRRTRPKPQRGSISATELSSRQKLRASMVGQKSTRSGSNNTMHKIGSHSSGDEGVLRPTTS